MTKELIADNEKGASDAKHAVSDMIIINNYTLTLVFTCQVEEQQRAIARQRKERGEEWRSEV